MKHYKSVKIFSNFRMSSPPEHTKSPLLKTFWWRFYTFTRHNQHEIIKRRSYQRASIQ